MYVYLREASMLCFLYGRTLFTVIQTGTIAAIAISFARFNRVAFPIVSKNHYLVSPIHILPGYAISLSTTQALALGIIFLIALINCYGVQWGKLIQNL